MEDFRYVFGLITFEGRNRCDFLAAKRSCVTIKFIRDLISLLLCWIVLLPIICWRSVFLRKLLVVMIEIFLRIQDWLVKRGSVFQTIDLILGKVWLYVIEISILHFLVKFYFDRSVLSATLALSICSLSVTWW